MFKDVTSGTIDIKKKIDEPYTGIYMGFKEITTKIGEQFIYQFKDGGVIFGIYGFTTLNMAMQNVAEGSLCRVTYLGTKNMETKFGMKDVHICRVEVDDEHIPEPVAEIPESDINSDMESTDELTDIEPF